jgi:hypothetical protein
MWNLRSHTGFRRGSAREPALGGSPTAGGVAGALAAPWKQARGFDSPAVHPLLAGPVYLSCRCFESNRHVGLRQLIAPVLVNWARWQPVPLRQ